MGVSGEGGLFLLEDVPGDRKAGARELTSRWTSREGSPRVGWVAAAAVPLLGTAVGEAVLPLLKLAEDRSLEKRPAQRQRRTAGR